MTSKIDESERSIQPPNFDGAIDLINENEGVREVVEVGGLEYRSGGTVQRVDRVVRVLVTDRRLLFATEAIGDTEMVSLGSIPFRDLAAVEVVDDRLAVETADGGSFRVHADGLAGIAAELRWLAGVRERIRDIAAAAGHRTTDDPSVTDDRPLRHRLDRLACAVFLAEPISTAALAPELNELDRRLESDRAHRLVDRGETIAAEGLAAIEDDAMERARELLVDARSARATAAAHAAELVRGDGFVFGDRRAVDRRLGELEATLRDAAAALERLGTRETVRAQSTTDAGEKLQCWQRAYNRFDAGLDVLPASDPDCTSIRKDRDDAAEGLATVYATLARSSASTARQALESGDIAAAVDDLAKAVEHLESLSALAADLESADPSPVDDVLGEASELLDRLRQSAESATAGTTTGSRLADGTDLNVDADELAALSLGDAISLELSPRRGQ